MEILPQLLVFALITSATYALLAAGLTLIFSVLEFINFAYGDMAMAGAFSFFALYTLLDWPLVISFVGAVLFIALLGLVIERTTFRPVRDKQSFIPLILSIGVAIILHSVIVMIFGGGSQTYSKLSEAPTLFHLFGGIVSITLVQVIIIFAAIFLLLCVYLFLKMTKTGKAIRAVSDNKEIAAIMGINVNRMIAILFTIASGLAAIAGILIAFDHNLYPGMGLVLAIKTFAAIIVGGVGKFHGAIVGAIIIAFSENLIVGLTPIHSSYKDVIVFFILILVLLVKPYGIFGGKKDEVESQ